MDGEGYLAIIAALAFAIAAVSVIQLYRITGDLARLTQRVRHIEEWLVQDTTDPTGPASADPEAQLLGKVISLRERRNLTH